MARPAASAPVPVASASSVTFWHGGGWLPLMAVLVILAAVRWAALFNDLWLDEIWSLHLLREIGSPMEILTRVRHDNNHPLNSLFLYALGPAQPDWSYRLLSWLSGVATVALGAVVVRHLSVRLAPDSADQARTSAGLVGALLLGGSYLLIHYSSEARGYAPAVCFSLLALLALLRDPTGVSWRWACVYAAACGLGLLAHVTVVQIMLGGLAWSVAQAVAGSGPSLRRGLTLARWHAAPWLFFTAYYFGFVRKLEIGGGPGLSPLTVLGDLGCYTFGLPTNTSPVIASAVLFGLPLLALAALWRRGERPVVAFFGVAVFVAPVLGVWLGGFTLFFPRYFIVSAALALVLVGTAMARAWSSGRTARIAGAAFLLLFLAGNAVHTVRLLRFGRGHYRDAIRYVIEHTSSSTITLSSDRDGRNVPVFEHHISRITADVSIVYLPGEEPAVERPEWLFVHRLDHELPPAETLKDPTGSVYRRERLFRHAALSGWDWHVFRKQPRR